MAENSRGAVFLDRDGTIVQDPGFLHQPEAVRMLPGVPRAIRRLNRAGWPVVTVTNQSGIARGMYPESDYHRVQQRIAELLATAHARIDASYFCPHLPEFTGPCECRKPGTKLFRDAAAALGIDLALSWYVGDRSIDVVPAHELGGHGVLVLTGQGPTHRLAAQALGARVVSDLAAAVDLIGLREGPEH